MVLTLTNCSVQLKNQLTVSLARQCSAGYQALHAISSLSDLMEGVLCVLQVYYVTLETLRFIILFKIHKLRKKELICLS